MADKIEITGVDLVKFVKKVYDLSQPQGMGFMHYREGPLSDNDAKAIIKAPLGISMDYVHDRSCKMNVYKEGDKLFIRNPWYDHSDADLLALLMHLDIALTPDSQEHGVACNCVNCIMKRGSRA